VVEPVAERVEAHIRRHELIEPGGAVLCLVSGGADSTCLQHVLRELGYRVSALHVDHGLRGNESDADAAFCARELGAEVVAAPGGGKSEAELRRARLALANLYGMPGGDAARGRRIALVGLRGAGKSTLGRRLGAALEMPFIELSREIERIAGCSIREIHDLYGSNAYRRYERRALDETVRLHAEAVIATPGGIVAEPATFNALLESCHTIWLQASPEEHMARVAAQGDTRPMAASREAMADLRRILAGRAAFYAKADAVLDTAGESEAKSLHALTALAGELLGGAPAAKPVARRRMKQTA